MLMTPCSILIPQAPSCSSRGLRGTEGLVRRLDVLPEQGERDQVGGRGEGMGGRSLQPR